MAPSSGVWRGARAISLRLCLVLAFGCSALGCSAPASAPPASYLTDASFRRAELEASLVNPGDGYARLRLEHYATGTTGDWERLPEWNPVVEPIALEELDAALGASTTSLSSAAEALALPAQVSSDEDPALVALGKSAFERYPVQPASYLRVALGSRAAARSYGLWLDEARGAGGLVRTRLADGSVQLAFTCASCHAAPGATELEPGRPNAALDLGAALVDAAQGGLDVATAHALGAWGPGRLDVTTSTGLEPARITDLRPVRFQANLQQDATLRMRGRTTLAIRIETLVITSNGQALRPPRVVALALAAYLMSLGAALPSPEVAANAWPAGARVFSERCASCHAPPAFSGPAVPLEVVGTEPSLGLSAERGTGTYRVPSLRGVATRGPLLHDGTLPSLAAMFDPTRTDAAFTGALHGVAGVAGHLDGLDLPAAERSALLAYLGSL